MSSIQLNINALSGWSRKSDVSSVGRRGLSNIGCKVLTNRRLYLNFAKNNDMNNEETRLLNEETQPGNGNVNEMKSANKSANKSAKKSGKDGKAAAVAGGFVAGAAAGFGASAMAAENAADDSDLANQEENPGDIQTNASAENNHSSAEDNHAPAVESHDLANEVQASEEEIQVSMEDVPNEADMITPEPVDSEIRVLGVEAVMDNQGHPMNAAYVTDGENVAMMLDVDIDGRMDVILADVDGDGQISREEVAVIPEDVDITIGDLAQAAGMEQVEYYTTDEDMVDYSGGDDIVDNSVDGDMMFI